MHASYLFHPVILYTIDHSMFPLSDTIWVIVQVDSGGTLGLMQQMVNLKELGSSSSAVVTCPNMTLPNPFAPLHLGQQQNQQQQQPDQQQQQHQQQHVNGNIEIQNQQQKEISAASPLTSVCQQDNDGDIGMS